VARQLAVNVSNSRQQRVADALAVQSEERVHARMNPPFSSQSSLVAHTSAKPGREQHVSWTLQVVSPQRGPLVGASALASASAPEEDPDPPPSSASGIFGPVSVASDFDVLPPSPEVAAPLCKSRHPDTTVQPVNTKRTVITNGTRRPDGRISTFIVAARPHAVKLLDLRQEHDRQRTLHESSPVERDPTQARPWFGPPPPHVQLPFVH
jgi:hypothetical protein